MISILHPSRGRASQSIATTKKFVSNADNISNIEVIISIDYNDPQRELYYQNYSRAPLGCVQTIFHKENKSAVDAINSAASNALHDIMIVVSDDTECYKGWDTDILKTVGKKKDWILKTQDGIQPWIITMPIMDRAYYNRFGYIYHPDYLHMFCDTELTCVADITGRKITSKLLFPHKHYSVTKQAPDAVNKKADATWAQGEKLFLDRYKRNFDLPKGQPIQDGGIIRWLQMKPR